MSTAERTHFVPDQYADAYAPGVENNYWHIARNRMIEARIRALGGGRVLDFGCGRGILVEHLLHRGIDCYGIELGQPLIPDHLSKRLMCGLGSNDLPVEFRKSIEVIVLGDVIEHLPDPPAFLRQLQLDFPAVRGFVITVPARTELWSNYDEHYGHYRRYDLPTLKSDLWAGGIVMLDSSYIFRLLYLPARILLLMRGKRTTNIRVPKSRFIHTLAAAVIGAELSLLPSTLYGTSLICNGIPRVPLGT